MPIRFSIRPRYAVFDVAMLFGLSLSSCSDLSEVFVEEFVDHFINFRVFPAAVSAAFYRVEFDIDARLLQGLVQYDATELYELVSYGTTPVELATWSRVKMLYR